MGQRITKQLADALTHCLPVRGLVKSPTSQLADAATNSRPSSNMLKIILSEDQQNNVLFVKQRSTMYMARYSVRKVGPTWPNI